MKTEQQQQIYDALKAISEYQDILELRDNSEEEYGLEYEEALEMAYDNVLQTARYAIKGLERPT